MSAIVKIDGESRGAQEAIAKVEVGLRGVASTAVASSSTTSAALGGMAASFGRMTTAVFLGGSAVEVARKGIQILTGAVTRYVAENEEAQQQTEAFTQATDQASDSVAAFVLNMGEASGVTSALTYGIRLLGDALDALGQRSAGGIGSAATVQSLRTAERLAADSQERIDEIGRLLDEYNPVSSFVSVEAASLRAERDMLNARIEDLQAVISSGSQAVAQRGAEAIAYAARLAQFGGPNAEAARPDSGGGRSRERVDEMRAGKEEEIALADKLTIRREAMIESFNETGALERERVDAIQAQADREVEIERGKQAALVELRASVKAGDLQADAEQAAAALDVIRGRQEDIARTTSDMVAGIISSNEKVSKSTIKGLANQLAVRGIEALYEGGMMLFHGNPAGLGLAALGGSALGAAKGLGSSISEGGGRGAGAAAAPVTNNNVQVRVVAPAGMTTDTAAYVAAAAEEGARRGLAQDRR